MSKIADEILMHYGIKRRSGRYPWGSGEDPYQRDNRDFLGRIEDLKKQGWTETPENIKKEFNMSTTLYRAQKSLAKSERRQLQVARAKSLREDGLNDSQIGREMGVNESTVRSWFNEKSEARMNKARKIADFLKQQVDEKGMIDVGKGVERELSEHGVSDIGGVSKEKLKQALKILQDEGYPVYGGGIPQATNPGRQTNQTVLCPPGTPHKAIWNFDQIRTITEYESRDGGETFKKFQYPESLDSKRLKIRYAEEGGIEKDGLVEIRRGVSDLSLGNDRYAQVRIMVDGTHYIKGMAAYSDDLPDGVDVMFNTNKKLGTDMKKVLKPIKDDPDNPFGSLIKPNGQSTYIDADGNERLSLINKRASEGDWSDWADALPSQFLAKQPKAMAKKQLGLAKADKMSEYEDICALTNPTIKKHYLDKFADECDSAAVHLKAAALPGQKYHVIIPINTLKDTEVYAPNYEDGTKLALIRYPHGGIFEIPVLKVNNKNPLAKKVIGTDSIDGVGINAKIAEQLSGADFDGDTVMCIPTHDPEGKVKISHREPLKGLEGFDPKAAYPEREGMRYMKHPVTGKDQTQMEMGVISNLITDMTLGGANDDELARAVRHSMVVIDAGKHKLDYKQSELDNDILSLKKKYQVKVDDEGNVVGYGGAATLLSRSKSKASVIKRQGSGWINTPDKPWYDPDRPEGAVIYKTADDAYYADGTYDKVARTRTLKTTDGKKITYSMDDKDAVEKYTPVKKVDKETGEVTFTSKDGTISYRVETRTDDSTKMAETDDARTLISAHRYEMEEIYADYANSMKALANRARKELISTPGIKVSQSAKVTYKEEVSSLLAKLNRALLNNPREREAQRRANAEVNAKKEANPSLTKAEIKKMKQQAIAKHRDEVGATSRRDRNIEITDREWEAIQAGAISESNLVDILANTDADRLRERAMPRASTTLSTAKVSTIRAMSASNYTMDQIAKRLGVSVSTVSKYLKGEN